MPAAAGLAAAVPCISAGIQATSSSRCHTVGSHQSTGTAGCTAAPSCLQTQRVSSEPWACVRVLSRHTIGLLARRRILGRVAQRIETELSRVRKRAATRADRSRDVAAVSQRWRRRRWRRLPRALSHQQAAHQCNRDAAPHLLRVPRSYSTRREPPPPSTYIPSVSASPRASRGVCRKRTQRGRSAFVLSSVPRHGASVLRATLMSSL